MITKFIPSQAKPWNVKWIHPYTGRRLSKSFATEEELTFFVKIQKEMLQKEKEILKKSRKQKIHFEKITVKDLLDKYFLHANLKQSTISTSRYHVTSIVALFGKRIASLLTSLDILKFSEIQHLQGVSQTTINRRVSILRAALNWAVRNRLIGFNPLSDLQMPCAKSRRIAPPTFRELFMMLLSAAPHVQRVIILGMYLGARIGPSELFRLQWHDVDLNLAIVRLPSAEKIDNVRMGAQFLFTNAYCIFFTCG